ncbi:SusC/RagA family TonB-linked outer membrane protein [Mangrovibacterium diazotrophicum]|uniref:TonB-linked SusC/RagA family outer membrane protein n=1 Tax=Mangrovibacterium diazotrophicum TaxID=1261403 RepID=A0A419WBH8_9BACT|nr:TonB-dependent receptor [Mangrovibacterium diazotrophicum]RKD92808.1 TonB-linked SusC/RagA family outer membrane protein [Mangrovibacterium diazotrophicum]
MKQITLLLAIFAIGLQSLFAQAKVMTGVVTSADDGSTMPGVAVLVKGTTIGTITDIDGKYSIKAPDDASALVFSFVGMETAEVAISGTAINVSLKPSLVGLNEVIVVGYGEQSKRDVTSAISSVNAEDVQKISVANLSGALQGTTTGVQISQVSGAPGGEVSMRIRGATSLNGSNNPLFIVDGVPVETSSTLSNNYGGQQNNALSSINPEDIASIEILKDAASAAIYGSRASNGVVLITTKRGKQGKAKISINSYYGIQNPLKKYKTANYGEWLKYGDDSYAEAYGAGYWSYYQTGDESLWGATDETLASFYASVADQGDNYIDKIYRDNAAVSELSGSISGGDENTKYYIGASSFNQKGMLLGQDYKRSNFRLNLDQKFNDKFRSNVGFALTSENQAVVNNDNNIYGVLSTAILEAPGNDIYDENGDYTSDVWTFSNPVQNALENQGGLKTLRLLTNAEFQYDLTNWLTFSSKYGLDNLQADEKEYDPSDSSSGSGSNGYAREDVSTIRRTTTTQAFSFKPIINDDISFSGFLAGEYTGRYYKYVRAATTNFPSTELKQVSSGSTLDEALGSYSKTNLYSVISRVTGKLFNKYIAELSMRADGSSKFGPSHKWGYFPSASAGYVMSEESWFDVKPINFFKLRASYGMTGNDSAIDPYTALAGVSSTPYAGTSGTAITELGNVDLKWETTKQLDLGFSVHLLDNKISVEYDYFNKKTSDMLLNVPLPGSTGYTEIYKNVGEMKNTGHEILLTFDIFSQSNFSWTAIASLSTLKNEVVSLDGNSPYTTGFASRVEEGVELGAFYVLQSEGIYKSDDEVPEAIASNYGVGAGDVKYVDQNGDGLINDDDYIIGGSPWPDFTYSLKNSLKYKSWDLDFLFTGSQGNDVFNSTLQYAGSTSSVWYNKFVDQLDYWSESNPDASLPHPKSSTRSYNNKDATRFVEDGSYLKLRNVTLGYQVPSSVFNGVADVRLYFSADNLLMITGYSGIDPEVNYSGDAAVTKGTDFLSLGGAKTFKFGINVNF